MVEASASPPPHGGRLVDLRATPARTAELRETLHELPSWDLTARQICDLEMLATGAFSPLEGFMRRAVAETVAATSLAIAKDRPMLFDAPDGTRACTRRLRSRPHPTTARG